MDLDPRLLFGAEALIAATLIWLLGPIVERRLPDFGWLASPLAALLGGGGVVLVVAALAFPSSGGPREITNPVDRTVSSIAAGEGLYRANCAQCHGVDARGGGPMAGTTPVQPPPLIGGHLAHHSDLDLFTWITEGLPGGMPAFGQRIREEDRWNVINFLRDLSERVEPPSVSPSGSAP